MLYLVRKLNEATIINNNLEIKVVEIKKNSVKIGITFPPEASVLRKELYDKIKKEEINAPKEPKLGTNKLTSEVKK